MIERRNLMALFAAAAVAPLVPAAATAAPDIGQGPTLIEWGALSPQTKCFVLLDYWRAAPEDVRRNATAEFRRIGDGAMGDVADVLNRMVERERGA